MQTVDWIRRHVYTSLVVALMLGTATGWAVSSGRQAPIEERLRTLRSQAIDLSDDLRAEKVELAADLDSALSDNAALERELVESQAEFPLPELVGRGQSIAEEIAKDHHWTLVVEERWSTRPNRTILSQQPAAGVLMSYQRELRIVVSKEIPKMPDVTGVLRVDAIETLNALGVKVKVLQVTSDRKEGTVLSQSVPPGERVTRGAVVILQVAEPAPKPPPVAKPDSSSSSPWCPGVHCGAYELAVRSCGEFTYREVAKEYGVPSTPEAAADAYARDWATPAAYQAAWDGCMTGFGY